MYKIIGVDKNEYGPITAEQLRQWIAEGRVNGQTSAWSEGAAEWQPLSAFPEFAEALAAAAPGLPPPAVTPAVVSSESVLGRNYDLDIGQCIARSWALVKQHFWPIVGVSLLVTVAIGGANQLIGLISGPAIRGMIFEHRFSPGAIALVFATSLIGAPIYAILMGGLFKYYLKLIRGEAAALSDAFSGFSSALGQLAVLGLVSHLLTLLGYLFCVLPGIYLYVSWIFAIPLVIDRRMDFWDAMELSRRVVSKHWFIVFAFLLVIGLIGVGGMLACCLGILVTLPIFWGALMYAYEDIFGQQAS